MTEILLAGLLSDWARTQFQNATFAAVLAPQVSISEDGLGMPVLLASEGNAELLCVSELSQEERASLERVASAYALESKEVKVVEGDRMVAYRALGSSHAPALRDDRAIEILEGVLAAKTEHLARAIVIGAGYRLAAYALAHEDDRDRKHTHIGRAADLPELDIHPLEMGFYEMVRMRYRHKRFDGEISAPLDRDVLVSGDAAIALPYDPLLDQVVLIEQLRPAALARRSLDAWGLEAVAGLISQGETAQYTAARELEEEAGLEAIGFWPVSPSYQSPGTLSQFMYPFVVGVDLTHYEEGNFGLPSEGEDIRTHILAREQAIAFLKTGEANNAPLQILLYELALNCREISAHLLAEREKAK